MEPRSSRSLSSPGRVAGRRVLLWLAPAVWLAGAWPSAAAPDIACDETNYSFGVITDDTNITHRFVLRNQGDAALKIERIKATCACAKADLSRNDVPPGGTADLTVELNMRGRSGKQDHPTFVFSNDPDTPRFQVTCQGEVRLDVEVRPCLVYYQFVPGDDIRTHELSVVANNGKQVRILGLETDQVAFCTVKMETFKADYEYRLKITPKAEMLKEKRRLDGKIFARTDHPRYARVEIPVTVLVEDEILAVPGELPLEELPPEVRPPDWSILVRSRREKAFEITRTEAPDKGIQITTTKRGPGEYVLRVAGLQASKGLEGKAFRVWIKKSGGEEEIIEIPVRIKWRERRR